MIDKVNVVVEVGRELGGGVDDIEVHCVVHDSRPGSGAGQLNDGFASGRLMASNVVSYSRKVRELSGVLGTRGRHPDFFFISVGKVMERGCKMLLRTKLRLWPTLTHFYPLLLLQFKYHRFTSRSLKPERRTDSSATIMILDTNQIIHL